MVKEVDLLSYWMPVLRQLKEFKEIAKAEEPELRYLLEACDRTLSNFFITTADEYGISRFESIMGIYPEEGETLETRRFNLLLKWVDRPPYTDNALYNMLISICGSADKFSITKNYAEYWLKIVTYLSVNGSFDAVVKSLQEMLPCNLVLDIENNLYSSSTTVGIRPVTVATTAFNYYITNDIKEATVNTVVGVRPVTLATTAFAHSVTNDIKENIGSTNASIVSINSVMSTANVLTLN